jgi:chorismate synthase
VPFAATWGEVPRLMLRYLTAGESHGPCLTAILEGLPAGVPVPQEAIDRDLARRQGGYGRGGRMRIEADRVEITAGVRHGVSLGSPLALVVRNLDGPNWSEEMSPQAREEGWQSARQIRVPRPGHADLAGGAKYGHRDLRNVLERASARETAARVAVGAVCRGLLRCVGVGVVSVVRGIGGVEWDPGDDWDDAMLAAAESSDVRCAAPEVAAAMRQAIDEARAAGDTLGGVVEVRAREVPVGLGSHVAADRRLDARLAAAVMGVPAIKGVEIGLGFAAAAARGSEVHDAILPGDGPWPFRRETNRAGGVEGGISTGLEIVVRAAMKPIPTLTRPLASVSLDTLEPVPAHAERSDVCAVPAAAVVVEAAICFELAAALLEKFGGDHLDDTRGALAAYRERLSRMWGADG